MNTIFNSNKAGQNGFTLLEIMVAIAIMAIAFTGMLKLHTQTVAMNIASSFYATAPLLAQKIIAEWEIGMATDNISPDLNNSLEEFSGFSFEINHEILSSDGIYPEQQKDNDTVVAQIICTIFFNQGEFQYTATSLAFISP